MALCNNLGLIREGIIYSCGRYSSARKHFREANRVLILTHRDHLKVTKVCCILENDLWVSWCGCVWIHVCG